MNPFEGLNLAPDVQSFRKNTTTAIQGVKDNSLTPVDITSKKMKEGIALKTSRDTGLKGQVTAYRDTVVDALDGIIGALSGGTLNTKDLTKAIKIGRDGVMFDENAILSTVSRAMGYPVSSQTGAHRKLAQDISREFQRITGLNVGGIISSDGKDFRLKNKAGGSVAAETMKQLTKFFGFDEFIDRSVQSAMYNSIYNNAALNGMSDSYRKIYYGYPPGFEWIRRDATLEALQNMITNGDIKSVQVVLDILDEDDDGLQANRKIIASKYPNFIENLFSNFKFDDDVFPEDYPGLLAMLLDVLERIQGDNWWLKHTEFGDVLNLAIMTRASKDMVTLLQGFPPIIPLLCTAGIFNEESALVVLRRQFKGAAQFPN